MNAKGNRIECGFYSRLFVSIRGLRFVPIRG